LGLPALQQGRSAPFRGNGHLPMHLVDLDGASGEETLHATTAFDVDRSSVPSLRGYRGGSSDDSKVKTLAAAHQWELDRAERFRPLGCGSR
jgi:hypothetical protein